MATAKTGDKVTIELSGATTDGYVFASDDKPETVEFTIGAAEVIPGIDCAVIGMKVGETKSVDIPSDEAFGSYNQDMVTELDRTSIPPDQQVEEGQSLELHRADGQSIPAIVLSVTEQAVMIDANHPLAGRDLKLTIKLVKVV